MTHYTSVSFDLGIAYEQTSRSSIDAMRHAQYMVMAIYSLKRSYLLSPRDIYLRELNKYLADSVLQLFGFGIPSTSTLQVSVDGERGDWFGASDILQDMVKQWPNEAALHFDLAVAYQQQKLYGQSLRELATARQLDPRSDLYYEYDHAELLGIFKSL
jgi:tetratricopeptide (TPR) repeat protein